MLVLLPQLPNISHNLLHYYKYGNINLYNTHYVQFEIVLLINKYKYIYTTTIGGPSSKFDEFLAARLQVDIDHGVDFLHLANRLPLCDRLLRFIVLCFLRENIIHNAAFRYRRANVYAGRLMNLRNR